MNFPAKAKICLMFIKYIDMMIPTLHIEFKQVDFITFQIFPIIKKLFQSSNFICFQKGDYVHIWGLKSNAFCLLLTLSGFKTFGFVRHSFVVHVLSVSLIDSSTDPEFLRAKELFVAVLIMSHNVLFTLIVFSQKDSVFFKVAFHGNASVRFFIFTSFLFYIVISSKGLNKNRHKCYLLFDILWYDCFLLGHVHFQWPCSPHPKK